jgi:transposase
MSEAPCNQRSPMIEWCIAPGATDVKRNRSTPGRASSSNLAHRGERPTSPNGDTRPGVHSDGARASRSPARAEGRRKADLSGKGVRRMGAAEPHQDDPPLVHALDGGSADPRAVFIGTGQGTRIARAAGMHAYSSDLRERLVRAVDQGRSQRAVARLFRVGVRSVKRYLQQRARTGSLERRPIPGGPRRSGGEREAARRARVEAAPEATWAAHCAWWAEHQGQRISGPTMWRAIRRVGGTRKKGRWVPASATRRHGRAGASS